MQQQGKGKILLLFITVILCLTAGFSLGFYGQQIRRVLHRHEKPYLVLIPEQLSILQSQIELSAIRWGVPVQVHKYSQFSDYALHQRENIYSMILHPQGWEIVQSQSGMEHISHRQQRKMEDLVDRVFPLKIENSSLSIPFLWRLWTLESNTPNASLSTDSALAVSQYQSSANHDLNEIYQQMVATTNRSTATTIKSKNNVKKINTANSSMIWRWIHHREKLETDLPKKAYLEVLVWTLNPKTNKESDFFTEVLKKWSLPENQKLYLKNEWATCFQSSTFSDLRMSPDFLSKIPLQNILPIKRTHSEKN
jgi:hypothetical protein